MAEIVLFLLIGIVAGSYVGKQEAERKSTTKRIERELKDWTPPEHADILKVCGQMCGENRFKQYSIMYGKCECVDTIND